MIDTKRLHLFGDQTNDFVSGLRHLLRIKDSPLLLSFFERTHIALRKDVARQSHETQEILPRFSRVADLLSAYSPDVASAPILASTLTTIFQLGNFIHYYGDGSRPYPSGQGHVVLGMCTGQLAACAVASASTVGQLVSLAVEAVVIAFRTGLLVMQARESLENQAQESRSWSSIVPGLQAGVAALRIEQFSTEQNVPIGSRPYVGAVAPSSVTIFGRPSILRDFFSSPIMADVKSVSVPVFAPYHEPHLYAESDIADILDCLSEAASNTTANLSVISSVTGELMQGSTFQLLLQASLAEILKEPLRLDMVIHFLQRFCEGPSDSQWVISSIGGNASQVLATALGEIKGVSVEVEDIACTSKSRTPQVHAGQGSRPEQSKIAIVGFSGRFPEAADPDSLWQLVHDGRDVHREIPPDRFNVDTHFDSSGKKKNTSRVRHGCFINEPGLFDCRFFNLSPKEADQSDPGQRLALMTACEALEMAGIVPDRTPSTQRDRVGIFYGMTSDDWREVNSGQDVGTYFIPGGNRAFTPGRINYHFKFSGPSVSIDTACSSSTAAIHMACNSLWRNDCDTAIAGGTNVMTNPDNFSGLDKGHFLSRTGNCKTFDDGADGYCRADAVGTVVLKRLEDALADRDPIQAVICGAYTNHSAEAESITRPHVGAQSAIFRRILSDAGHDPLDVSYIEMHGTGTQAGDATEMRSVLDVFAGPKSGRSAKRPLYLGSVKSNVGHSESGSGITSLIKIMMMLRNDEIPPHCGIKAKINSGFPTDLEDRGIRIAMKATQWQRPGEGRRLAFLNNFSAAGGNSALLVEDPPATHEPRVLFEDSRTTHVVAVSARTAKSLRRNIERLAEHLARNPQMSLRNLAYTTTTRRIHHEYRFTVAENTIAGVQKTLEKSVQLETRPVPRKTSKIAFAFTGQGSLYDGMGQQLFSSFRVFREELKRLQGISDSFGFDSFMSLITDSPAPHAAPFSPQATQLALTCFQIALARLWRSFGIAPSVVVGHSLGEYAALHIAGVLSARDVVFLVGTRARIMQDQCPPGTHGMLAVKAPLSALEDTLRRYNMEVACINGPTQTVIAGLEVDLDAAQEALQLSGIKTSRLKTSFAFHTSQVEPVLKEFEKLSSGVVFRKPTLPLISPLLADVITDQGRLGHKYLARHCRETVNIAGAIQSALVQSVLSEDSICLEIGPSPVVTGMLKASIGPGLRTLASVCKGESSWATMGKTLSIFHQFGFNVRWSEYHRDFEEFNEVISLPAYQWDYKNHWIQYANDFCLTKGNPPAGNTEAVKSLTPAPVFLSATCQKILQAEHGPTKSSVLIESDLSHPDLRAVLESHKVNGAILCPSSVYADVAMTLGNYLFADNPLKTNRGIEVADMATTKPLLMQTPGKSELFRAFAEADWDSQTAGVTFYSVNSRGESTVQHATCTIRFGDPDAWLSEWKRMSYLVRSRMQSLRDATQNGSCHLIKRGMAYKLFENCVEYGESFQGMDEVCLDSKGHEATARVSFKDKSTCFHANPYHIDSLGHLSGFIMNATESFDYKSQVFLNHGWESIRCAVKPSAEDTYQTYVKMQSSDGTRYVGDVYVFSGDSIIGVNQGVAFQAVPRKVLDFLLPGPTKVKPAKETAPASSHRSVSSQNAAVAEPKPASIPAQKKRTTPQQGNVSESFLVSQAFNIIAEETGVAIDEMKDDLAVADVGIDSLLTLAICSRLREDLNIDVSSTLFLECLTFRDLKRYLGSETDASENSSKSSTVDSGFSGDDTAESASDVTNMDPEDKEPFPAHDKSSVISGICQILADEIGVNVEDVWGAPSLAEMGLDSLMSLAVLGRLREELDLDLPIDFFSDDNIASISGRFLDESPVREVSDSATTPSKPSIDGKPPANMPASSSVVLQGNLVAASKILFLFPDGSGSATSYATLPRVAPEIAVVGLNCPYMKQPQDLKCALQDLTTPYLNEIRRRQPHGPYYLGGWSAGGICAYDAAAKLMACGEKVGALILIDSPNPICLDKLPVRLYHFLSSVGMFGSGSKPPPAWLLPHFLAFIDALDLYDPKPFESGTAPETHAIWAADGVYRSTGGKRLEEQPDDTAGMKWLLNDRIDRGPNGWDKLVGRENLRIEVLEGANHFTMMKESRGRKLSEFLARSMGV